MKFSLNPPKSHAKFLKKSDILAFERKTSWIVEAMSLRDPNLNGNLPHITVGEVGEVGSHTEVGDAEEGDSDEIFCDSEYDVGSDTEDEKVETECDDGVEGSGREDEGDNLEESSGEGEGELSNSEDFNSDKDSDEGVGTKYPVFSNTETFDPKFDIGMLFSSKKQLRIAIHSHAVKTRRNIKITKNDNKRLYARCVEEGCEWKLHALVIEELKRSNLGSTFILSRAASDGSGGSKFGKLYVCFEGLKMGFLAGCRKIIGVDGVISRVHMGGETWEWFLTLLRNDLNIHRDSDYTFMSDKQKGLIPAFETVFPTAENRFYVRHLHANMKRVGFKGLSYKKALWKAARATTVTEFEARRKEICKLDIKMDARWRRFCGLLLPFQTYLRVYDPCIYPVNGPKKWNKTNIEPLLLQTWKTSRQTSKSKKTGAASIQASKEGTKCTGITATPSVVAPGASPTPSSSRHPSPTLRPGVTFAHVPFAPDHSQVQSKRAQKLSKVDGKKKA
ncbi:UNVERIFIED_CONTAM: hypothetical protein Scaly_2230100 [Sesamum calycinum]|uniref:Transposase MuDR plant domain-containing protein n=1 Tax=Sesamum calycinum TaxID=2727403 RepID=A0AAW2M980_9LAMI